MIFINLKNRNMRKLSRIIFTCCITLFIVTACENESNDPSAKGYIVASFKCGETDPLTGYATGELTQRGFFIVLENKTDSFYTFSLSENLFDFPEEILTPTSNINNCGPIYFPDKYTYKIRFKYRDSKDSEKIEFGCFCYHMLLPFNWDAYKQVIIEEVSTINP
jgi:hypothetical protein